MKYLHEFRDGDLAKNITRKMAISARQHPHDPNHIYRIMEFCGGHTHAISRYGLLDLLPENIKMIHGPGCPVCVLPIGRIDQAIHLALHHHVILCTYADTLRIPASDQMTLLKAKSQGAQVRMIYSTQDALNIARNNPSQQVVFFAIGFETTTPPTAVAIQQAHTEGMKNFSILCNHVLTPAAMHAILAAPAGVNIDGFVGPAHVSTVIGSDPYEVFAHDYQKPVVIAGFEPLDVLQAIFMIVQQINHGESRVENEFTRAVTPKGNEKAQRLMQSVFGIRDDFEWRGLGTLSHSALRLTSNFSDFDAEQRFGVDYHPVPDNKACECARILRGEKSPQECKIFGTVCTPENPIGSCMVSSEGACAAHYTYRRIQTLPH